MIQMVIAIVVVVIKSCLNERVIVFKKIPKYDLNSKSIPSLVSIDGISEFCFFFYEPPL